MQRDADRITKLFTRTIRRTVADFVKIGRELNTMNDTRYPYGAFERLFQDLPRRCRTRSRSRIDTGPPSWRSPNTRS